MADDEGLTSHQRPREDPPAAKVAIPDGAIVAAQRRPSFTARDLTKGSVPRNLWFLSWPQLVEGLLNILDQLADLLWAGRLGSRAIAGLGVAQTYTQLGMMVRQGLDTSSRAMIARAVGVGNIPLANHAMLQGFTLSGVYILLITGLGIAFTDLLLNLIGVSEAVHAQAATYMRVQFVAMAITAARGMSGAALQASGDVVTPMKSTIVARVIHIVLSPCLVFGWWWFPKWGLPGAAAANVFGQTIGSFVVFYVLLTGRSRLKLTLRGYRIDIPILWRMFKIAAPASVAGAERAFAQLFLLAFVTPFGDLAVAAYSVTRRIETFAHVGSQAFGQASGVLVGQNLGAGEPQRARQALRWGLGYVSTFTFIFSVLLLLFPAALMSIFNQEPEFLDVGVTWLRIQCIAFIFLAPAVVYQQTFNTAGDTMSPLVVSLIAFWGVQIPMAWLLPKVTGLGQFGITWAIALSMFFRLVLFIPVHLRGSWLGVKVLD